MNARVPTHAIPRALRRERQWLLWKKEDGRKVPYYVNGRKRSGDMGDARDRAHMATYDQALGALTDEYAGLGFAIFPETKIACLDLDDCFNADGSLKSDALAFVAVAGRTYIERSVSGDGLHIWVIGSIKDERVDGVCEMFSEYGYIAVTGNAYGEPCDEIAEASTAFKASVSARILLLRAGEPRRGRGRPRGRRLANWDAPSNLTYEQWGETIDRIDFDNREHWRNATLISGRMWVGKPEESEAWERMLQAAQRSEKWDDDAAGNEQNMREAFFTLSQREPRTGREPLNVGSLIAMAREDSREPDWIPSEALRDQDHFHLAEGFIASIEGERPVYAMGSLWRVEKELWRPWSMAEAAVEVGRRFGGGKYCKKGGDFNSVARLAAGIVLDENFFANAPVGFATPGGFWRVEEDGRIVREGLTAAHRQRFILAADPVDGEPKKLIKLLREAFEGHEPDAQIALLQQVTGCALTRSLWRHEIVTLLLGLTSSGKSTYLSVLRSAFPPDVVSATSPARWDQEYYVATLAGKALNIVGELDGQEAIPGGRFKTITGRDLVDGRHPTHQPFSFVCEAAHFFNSNRTPPTRDRDDSFFRRWRIVWFANVVPAERIVRDLDRQIVAEEFGEFLGWALRGASHVAQHGIVETATHRAALQRWRVGNNSALEFLCDTDECVLGADKEARGQELFDRYKEWARDAGMTRPFGRSGFYEAIERGGSVIGVRLVRRDNQNVVEGAALDTRM